MMAPAATVDLFAEKMLPHVIAKTVRQYNQWHLADTLELKDPTCRPILGYGRSLLYLVSESFEGGSRTPVIGMEKYYDAVGASGQHARVGRRQQRDAEHDARRLRQRSRDARERAPPIKAALA